jgi:WD40 repeat protein
MKKLLLAVFFCSCSIPGLFAQTTIETVLQKGHFASIKSIAIDSEGVLMATGSKDKTAKLWDINSGRELRSFVGHTHAISSVHFSRDGNYLVTSSMDGTACVWEVATGQQVFSTPPSEKSLTDAVFSPDGTLLLTSGYADVVSIYSFPSGNLIKTIEASPDLGLGLGVHIQFSKDGKLCALGEDNRTTRVYETSNWSLVTTIKPEEGWCGGCGTYNQFTKEGNALVKLSANSSTGEYDLRTGRLLTSYGSEMKDIRSIDISTNDRFILTATEKGAVIFQRGRKDSLLYIPAPENHKITAAALGVGNESVYIASDDNVVTEYNRLTGQRIKTFKGLLNENDAQELGYNPNSYWHSHISKYLRLKNKVILLPNGKEIIRTKTGKEIKLWDIATGTPQIRFSEHSKPVISLDITKDGKTIVSGDSKGGVKIWSPDKGQPSFDLKGHLEPILDIHFSPDESTVATSGWDATLNIFDSKKGTLVNRIDLNNNSAYTFSFTPDGLYLVLARLDKTLELFEPDSRTRVKTFIGHTDVVSSITFHPSQPNIMMSSSWDGTTRIWDIQTGLMIKKLNGNQTPVHAAVFTPDGSRVITAGDDRIIRVWDWQNGKVLKQLEGHKAEISNLTLSNDGKMLLSASLDGSVKFWNLEKSQEFFEHIYIRNKDWIVLTREGYFNGTSGAMNYVHFVKGTRLYSTEQLIEKFYKPDLLPSLFNHRGTGMYKSVEDLLKTAPPPSVKITALKSEGKAEAEVYLKVTDNGGGIDEIKVLHNGKRISFGNVKYLPNKKGEHAVLKETVSLVHGINSFEASAFSKDRIESSTSYAEIHSESGELASTCHILSIGIDKYKNPSMNLTFAKEDAEAFSKLLKEKGQKMFKKIELTTLYNEEATKGNILKTLNELAKKIQKNDVFIFYYAGHGSMTEDQFFFIPSECTRLYEKNTLTKEAIEASELQQKFREIKALKQIIIMDACHSGGSIEFLASRGGIEEKAIAQLARSSGVHVLASAGSNETAIEVSELGHGLFTYILLKALKGEADGTPKDGKITVYELKSFLDDQIPEINKKYRGKSQYPYTFSRGHDFPIVTE